jgi:hypothetical protein
VGDLIPTAAHAPDAWIMALDLYPMDTLEAKKRFAAEAIERRTLTFFAHDPSMAAAYLSDERGKRRADAAPADQDGR